MSPASASRRTPGPDWRPFDHSLSPIEPIGLGNRTDRGIDPLRSPKAITAMFTEGFRPIEEDGCIGTLETCELVAPNGSID